MQENIKRRSKQRIRSLLIGVALLLIFVPPAITSVVKSVYLAELPPRITSKIAVLYNKVIFIEWLWPVSPQIDFSHVISWTNVPFFLLFVAIIVGFAFIGRFVRLLKNESEAIENAKKAIHQREQEERLREKSNRVR